MAETGQPFALSEVNIIIQSKYQASGVLDKLTTGQNLTAIPDKSFFCVNFFFLFERTCILDSFQVNRNGTDKLAGKKKPTVAGNKSRQITHFCILQDPFDWELVLQESTCSTRDLGSIPGEEDSWKGACQTTLVFLPRESPWTEDPAGHQSKGSLVHGVVKC